MADPEPTFAEPTTPDLDVQASLRDLYDQVQVSKAEVGALTTELTNIIGSLEEKIARLEASNE